MKGLFKIILVVVALGAAGYGGFLYWKKMQDAKMAESTPAPDATLAAAAAPASAPAGVPAAPGATTASSAPSTMAAAYDISPIAADDNMSKAVATLTMDNGSVIKFRFYPKEAPNTVKRITDLIAQGFYNGIVVHRVEPGFVVQAGDPTGTGSGGSGVKLKAEFNARKHVAGILSMARTSDPDSADSQFFIMLGTAPSLDNQYSIFGKTVEGFENVQKIKKGDKIKSFTIQ
jgi:cyclophilin family peptidyl-prolyl cis-trans isomerase